MIRPTLVLAFVLLVTCAFGCKSTGNHLLGTAFETKAITTIASISGKDASTPPSPVTVHGTMTEKCPVAGCWFYLKDDSGTVKVDVKDAGFVVTDVPTGADMTVSGTIDKTGEDPVFVATGLRW